MADSVRIRMMDRFMILIGEEKTEQPALKTRKGAALMQYLILNEGKPVSTQTLMAVLWNREKSVNPENALKTLISRLRVIMNQMLPELGGCIASGKGFYRWRCMEGMTIDYDEIVEIFRRVKEPDIPEEEREELYERLLLLYTGDLLQNSEPDEWALRKAAELHSKYVEAVYAYIELLKRKERHSRIIGVCRRALEIDAFDDRLHTELVSALIRSNRTGEALSQYKHAASLNYRYLGMAPGENLQMLYRQAANTGKALDDTLDAICAELGGNGGRRGAFVCDYPVFREIHGLLARNLERFGISLFLGIILITCGEGEKPDDLLLDSTMNRLLEILTGNLRRGDAVSRFAPNMVALLLPGVGFRTGEAVLERIRLAFYREVPGSGITFSYRIGPLGTRPEKPLYASGKTEK